MGGEDVEEFASRYANIDVDDNNEKTGHSRSTTIEVTSVRKMSLNLSCSHVLVAII